MNLLAEFREGAGISWGALRANTLRSVLTTLGIIIGIVTVTLMGTAIEGLNRAFLQSVTLFGTDVLYVQRFPWFNDGEWWKLRNRREFTLENARAVARQSTFARAVSTEAHIFKTVQYKNHSAPGIWIVGNTEDSALVRGLALAQGRFFSGPEVSGARPVCVLGADIASNFFPNDSPLGHQIKVDENSYEVVGVIDKMGQFLTGFNFDNQVIIPITRLLTDFSWRPDLFIMVKVRDLDQIDEAREEIRGILRKLRRLRPAEPDDFAINEQQTFLLMFRRVAATIAAAGLFITGLSLFVGGIGIMNIMFVSVAERTREIGIRKALGARRRTILVQFLIEAASICLVGGALGVGLAWPLSLALAKVLPATMSIPVVAVALLVSLLTGVVAGFFPAWRAARMNPVEALRKE
ncbi:MAG TPA: ABC transporter permease [Verrucomicrobiae bacterium]